jgi:hypothetical protein
MLIQNEASSTRCNRAHTCMNIRHPRESMNKLNSSIAKWKEKRTHKMHYFQHVQHG